MPRPLHIEHEGTVAATQEAAYGVIANAAMRPRWLVELREVDAPEGLLDRGDVFTGRSRAFGHEVGGLSRVLEATPPTQLIERVVVGVGITSSWRLAMAPGGGTTVRAVLDVEPPEGPLAPVERLVLRWWLGRMQKRSLAALADLLEFSGGARPSRRPRSRWWPRPRG